MSWRRGEAIYSNIHTDIRTHSFLLACTIARSAHERVAHSLSNLTQQYAKRNISPTRAAITEFIFSFTVNQKINTLNRPTHEPFIISICLLFSFMSWPIRRYSTTSPATSDMDDMFVQCNKIAIYVLNTSYRYGVSNGRRCIHYAGNQFREASFCVYR